MIDTGSDEGMVTAELAVALPALLLVVITAMSVVFAAAVQLRCLGAAESAARLAARGQSVTAIETSLDGAALTTSNLAVAAVGSDAVAATVSEQLRLPILGLPTPFTLSARVVDPLEPGVVSP